MISASCKIGALCSNAPEGRIKSLASFGKNLGMAFQIQDDLLDMVGDNRRFGKALGSDLIEGKKTFLLLTALRKARDKDRRLLIELIQNKGVKPSSIKKYFEIYSRLEVDIYAQETIKFYIEKALVSLNSLSDCIHKEFLINFANQLLSRTH
jgi:geranylgeranyl pyrophosphate synthase